MSDYWTENGLVKPPSTVVCAANKVQHNGTDFLIVGARHWDSVMCATADALGIKGGNEEQGFINQYGEFLTRDEAMKIVKENGQTFNIERNQGDLTLFSEGLY